MSIITGEIALCSCSDAVENHDAFGCMTQDCGCAQTPAQFEQQQAVLASLDFLHF
ncbi:MAG: hypothetical protein M3126_00925 [Candidatus Eremiobacteraeota bacterium]|nr:hypothetical protein [Candidatus Eremiobacteraeota bacterium]